VAGRSARTGASAHVRAQYVFNVDLVDFFHTINFGRVRGLFKAAPFTFSDTIATTLAERAPEPPWECRRLLPLTGWSHSQASAVLRRSGNERCGWCRSIRRYPTAWAAITSVAIKIGCAAETLRLWVRQAERNAGQRLVLTTEEQQRLTQLERENRARDRSRHGCPDLAWVDRPMV
jgi:hypothetical protein